MLMMMNIDIMKTSCFENFELIAFRIAIEKSSDVVGGVTISAGTSPNAAAKNRKP